MNNSQQSSGTSSERLPSSKKPTNTKTCETCDNLATMAVIIQGYTPRKEFIIVKRDEVWDRHHKYEIYSCKKCYEDDILLQKSSTVTTISSRKI